jgi:hypothetical protein
MAERLWYEERAFGVRGWIRAQRYDWKFYVVFDIRRLVGNCLGVANDEEYRHLLMEWDLGNRGREEISYAQSQFGFCSPEHDVALGDFSTLCTMNRNRLLF